MKKLILVTLLAVAASWLLSEAGQPVAPESTVVEALDQFTRKPDRTGNHVVVVQDPVAEPAPIIRPPLPPEPPSPPDSMPVVPWRKGEGPRSKRSLTTPTSPKAKTAPSWFPKSEDEEQAKAQPDSFGSLVLVGRVSASDDRARQDLRLIVEQKVAGWLAGDIPPSWKVPAKVIDAMAQGSYVQEVTRNLTVTDPSASTPSTPEASGLDGLYTLYRAGQKLDFSPTRRAEIIGMYRHDIAARRLQRFGGGMALALVGLAVLSGYIKADEATKGYYTNRLRLLAAAGLGGAGVVAYRFLA